MLKIEQIKLPVGHTQEELTERVKKILRCRQTPKIIVLRRSIDARKKPALYYNYTLCAEIADEALIYRKCDKSKVSIFKETPYRFPVSGYQGNIRPVVIGTGPAGLFCGYMLAKAGFCPILLERGEPVGKRRETVRDFWESGKLSPRSNVQFGEGGAGTFSDGKLNTLVKDKYGRNREVLSLFVKFGAPEEILYDHKPHIGTDILEKVVTNIRQAILDLGGSVCFDAKVTDLRSHKGHITGVIVNEKESIDAEYVVLAPGHSARDTFRMLYEKGIEMEAKPFAVGMRVEHPQWLINRAQYGRAAGGIPGNAVYKLSTRSGDGRGVYSFCMCPGGFVVDASSEPGRLVVNGMSYSGRDGANANSAIIISVTPEDFGSRHPLSGVEFQRQLEERAYKIRNGRIPVERYREYKEGFQGGGGKESTLIPDDFAPAIKGRWCFGPVHEILPNVLGKAFVEGMEKFGTMINGFSDGNVLIEGLESRTSSPIRIMRGEDLQSSLKGLYPCGEGAGYAGGITSAAMDGIRVAEVLAAKIVEGA